MRPSQPTPTRAVRRAAPPIGRVADAVLRPLAKKRGPAGGIAPERWAAAAGQALAAHSTPLSLQRGILTVRATGPAALALQHRAAEIMEALNVFYGRRAVTRIALRQTG